MRLSRFFTRIVLFTGELLIPELGFSREDDQDSVVDTVKAQADPTKAEAPKSKAFNPGEMIIEHISDNHEWHVYGNFHIPLLCIVKTDKGFETFSSGNFRNPETHELQPYVGKNYTYALKEGKIVAGEIIAGQFTENEIATKTILDLSITKNVVTLFVVVFLMFFFFVSIAKSYKKREGQTTKGMQSLFEPLIVFVRDDIAKTSIGKKHERYMPYLLTVFFFVLIANLLGIVPVFPGGANFSGNITITMSLALFTFVITLFSANKNYWRHIFAMPGVPIGVLVILTPIEIFGMFLKPIVLMIRLFANMLAGHIIALSFYALIFIFAKGGESMGAGLGVSVASVAFCVFMMFLELLVAFIQAYVFTLLSAIYFGSAVEEHHGDVHDADDGLITAHSH